jgi:hypothetical protein
MHLLVWFSAITLWIPFESSAQSDAQVRLAFQNIRSDDIPGNAVTACAWLYANRNQLTGQLLDELYRTDRQGRDAILIALLATKSFQPDARFCQTVVSRLKEQDKFVHWNDLGIKAHWDAWRFIDAHYDLFKPLIMENFQATDDMWFIWGTISLLQKHGELAAALPTFSPRVWDTMARSLKNDDIDFNAGQAVRSYLIIGKDSLPHLKPLLQSADPQAHDLASATIDAMGGSRRAYGYLAVIVDIDRNIFTGGPQPPDWMDQEVTKWNPFSVPPPRYQ